MYRNNTYKEDLAMEMRDPTFAQGLLLNLMEIEEGMDLEPALRLAIEAMGIKEFCAKARLSQQYVNAFLKGHRNFKPESLDALLKPFGLRTKLTVEKVA